jgi:hypothetical protein
LSTLVFMNSHAFIVLLVLIVAITLSRIKGPKKLKEELLPEEKWRVKDKIIHEYYSRAQSTIHYALRMENQTTQESTKVYILKDHFEKITLGDFLDVQVKVESFEPFKWYQFLIENQNDANNQKISVCSIKDNQGVSILDVSYPNY